jgi:hypothetical protein
VAGGCGRKPAAAGGRCAGGMRGGESSSPVTAAAIIVQPWQCSSPVTACLVESGTPSDGTTSDCQVVSVEPSGPSCWAKWTNPTARNTRAETTATARRSAVRKRTHGTRFFTASTIPVNDGTRDRLSISDHGHSGSNEGDNHQCRCRWCISGACGCECAMASCECSWVWGSPERTSSS